jgi:hypothetical protein
MRKKSLIGIVIAVLILVTFFIVQFYFPKEKKTFAESDMEYFPIQDPCDLNCKERLENEQNYTCVEFEPNSYECRAEIKLIYPEHIYTYVIPPERGEFYLFTSGAKNQLGSITQVSFYTEDSVQITFDEKFGLNSTVIEKNQRFTSNCNESKNVAVWTFTGIVQVSGTPYIEMHKRLAKIPSGFDCNNPIHILEFTYQNK